MPSLPTAFRGRAHSNAANAHLSRLDLRQHDPDPLGGRIHPEGPSRARDSRSTIWGGVGSVQTWVKRSGTSGVRARKSIWHLASVFTHPIWVLWRTHCVEFRSFYRTSHPCTAAKVKGSCKPGGDRGDHTWVGVASPLGLHRKWRQAQQESIHPIPDQSMDSVLRYRMPLGLEITVQGMCTTWRGRIA